ncbi:MAG: hypothetical protein CVV44_06840 [Spirochaetae bacterium HGW-Spirochaetae-1]|jgi:PAS domain S-box-containing protein|nr:MAG: hypothetical protein CVV44_06840 [Spirochaetae bacterium HGW-Spirochaetae-1]
MIPVERGSHFGRVEKQKYLWRVIGLHSAGPALLTVVLFFVMIRLVFIPAFQNNLMDAKREMARELINSVWNLLNNYNERSGSGELTPAQARERAKERIRTMRYGPEDKDYFWINDMRPVIIMHPYRADLEGKDVRDFKDTMGKRVFVEFVDMVRQHNAGYVEYRWQWKDDPLHIVPKVSYVRLFEPWGWVVGTGVYIEDVEKDINNITRRINMATSGILAIIILLSIYIIWHHRIIELERLKIEANLVESEEKYRFLIENMNDGLIVVDKNGRIIYVNARMCEMTGYTAEELEKTIFTGYFDDENLAIITTQLERRRKGEYHSYEVAWTKKNGERVMSIVSPRPIYDKQGEYNGSFGVVTDLTSRIRAENEKKELQMQLIQTQKLDSIGKLAGGIAHDFNNILTVINGHAQMAMRKIDGLSPVINERLKKDIVAISEAGERAARLIRQLLVFSRKQASESVVVDINSVIGNLMKMILRLIGEDIRVETSLISPVPGIKGDPAQLEQVLINLIVNSRDSIAEGTDPASEKKIMVKTDRQYLDEEFCSVNKEIIPGEYVTIAVTDTGAGMDENMIGSIFEPFYTTKSSGKGTGLGLSIVYAIVRQHRGCINVNSKQGEGSTFTVCLPVCNEVITDKKDVPKEEPSLSGNECVLLVEDDINVRSFTEAVLAEHGYSVYSAGNGCEALSLISEKGLKPDLLLTDMIMPEMDGLELTGEYLRLFPFSRVIMMSGYTDRDMSLLDNMNGRVIFMHKPYSIQKLMLLIRESVDGPRHRYET